MRLSRFLNCTLLLTVLIILVSAQQAFADHLKGGWIKYTYLGTNGDNINYRVSFYQYSDCSEPEKVDNFIYLAVHDAGTSHEINTYNVERTNLTTEEKN